MQIKILNASITYFVVRPILFHIHIIPNLIHKHSYHKHLSHTRNFILFTFLDLSLILLDRKSRIPVYAQE